MGASARRRGDRIQGRARRAVEEELGFSTSRGFQNDVIEVRRYFVNGCD